MMESGSMMKTARTVCVLATVCSMPYCFATFMLISATIGKGISTFPFPSRSICSMLSAQAR